MPRNVAKKPSTSTGRAKTPKRLLSPNVADNTTTPKKQRSLNFSFKSEPTLSENNSFIIATDSRNATNLESKNDQTDTLPTISLISENRDFDESLTDENETITPKYNKRLVKNTKYLDFITNNEIENIVGVDDVIKNTKKVTKKCKNPKIQTYIERVDLSPENTELLNESIELGTMPGNSSNSSSKKRRKISLDVQYIPKITPNENSTFDSIESTNIVHKNKRKSVNSNKIPTNPELTEISLSSNIQNSRLNSQTNIDENKRSTRSRSRGLQNLQLANLEKENNNNAVNSSMEVENPVQVKQYTKEHFLNKSFQPIVLVKYDATIEKLMSVKLKKGNLNSPNVREENSFSSDNVKFEICTSSSGNNIRNGDVIPFDPNVYDSTLLEMKVEEDLFTFESDDLILDDIKIEPEEFSPCSSRSDISELFSPIRDCHIHLERLGVESNVPTEVNVRNSFNKAISNFQCDDETDKMEKSPTNFLDSGQFDAQAQCSVVNDDSVQKTVKNIFQRDENDSSVQNKTVENDYFVVDAIERAQRRMIEKGQRKMIEKIDNTQHKTAASAQNRTAASAQRKITRSSYHKTVESTLKSPDTHKTIENTLTSPDTTQKIAESVQHKTAEKTQPKTRGRPRNRNITVKSTHIMAVNTQEGVDSAQNKTTRGAYHKTAEITLKSPESTHKTTEIMLKSPESTHKTAESTHKTAESTHKTAKSTHHKIAENEHETAEKTQHKTRGGSRNRNITDEDTHHIMAKNSQGVESAQHKTTYHKMAESLLKSAESIHKTAKSALKSPESTYKTTETTLESPKSSHKTIESAQQKTGKSQHRRTKSAQHETTENTQHITAENTQETAESIQHKTAKRLHRKRAKSAPHKTTGKSHCKRAKIAQYETTEGAQHKITESAHHKIAESAQHKTTESAHHKIAESSQHKTTESVQHKTTESAKHKAMESVHHKTAESAQHKTPESVQHKTPESVQHKTPESVQQKAVESVQHKTRKHELNVIVDSQTELIPTSSNLPSTLNVTENFQDTRSVSVDVPEKIDSNKIEIKSEVATSINQPKTIKRKRQKIPLPIEYSHVVDIIENVIKSSIVESHKRENLKNTENNISTENIHFDIANKEDKINKDFQNQLHESEIKSNEVPIKEENKIKDDLKISTTTISRNEIELPVNLKEKVHIKNTHSVITNKDEHKIKEDHKVKEDLKKSTFTSSSRSEHIKLNQKSSTTKNLHSITTNREEPKIKEDFKKSTIISSKSKMESPVKLKDKVSMKTSTIFKNEPKINESTIFTCKSTNTPEKKNLKPAKNLINQRTPSTSTIFEMNSFNCKSELKSLPPSPPKIFENINKSPQKIIILEQKIKTPSPQKFETFSTFKNFNKTPEKVHTLYVPRKLQTSLEMHPNTSKPTFAEKIEVPKTTIPVLNKNTTELTKIKNLSTKPSVPKLLGTKSTDAPNFKNIATQLDDFNISNEPSTSTKSDFDLRQFLSEKRTKEKQDCTANKYKNLVIETSKNSNRIILRNPVLTSPETNQTTYLNPSSKTLKISPNKSTFIQIKKSPINENLKQSLNTSEGNAKKAPEIKINLFGKTLIRSNNNSSDSESTLAPFASEAQVSDIVSQKLNRIFNEQQEIKSETREDNFKGSKENLFDENKVESLKVIIDNDIISQNKCKDNSENKMKEQITQNKLVTDTCTSKIRQDKADNFVFAKPSHTFKFIEKCEVKRPPTRIKLNRPQLNSQSSSSTVVKATSSQTVFKAPFEKKSETKLSRYEHLNKPNVDDDVISILADTTTLESVCDEASIKDDDSDFDDEDDYNEDEAFMDKERFTQVKDWLSQSLEESVVKPESPVVPSSPVKKCSEIPIARVNPGIQTTTKSEEKSLSSESNSEERPNTITRKLERPFEFEIFKNLCFSKLRRNFCPRKNCPFAHELPNNWQFHFKALSVDALMRTYKYIKYQNMLHFYKITFSLIAEQLGVYKDFTNLTSLVKDVLEMRINTDREPLIKNIIQALVNTGFSFYSTVEIVFRSANVELNLKNLLCDILLNLTVERRQLEDNWPIILMLSAHKNFDVDKGIIQFIIIETLAKNSLQKDLVLKVYNDLIKKIPDFNIKNISATLCQKFIELLQKYNLQSDADELLNRCVSLKVLEKSTVKIEEHRNVSNQIQEEDDTESKCLLKESKVFEFPPPLITNYQKPEHLRRASLNQQQQEHYSNQQQHQEHYSNHPQFQMKQEHPSLLHNQNSNRTLINQPNQEHYMNRPPSHSQQEHPNILQNQEHYLNRPPSRPQQEHSNILQNQEHANQRTLINQPNQEHYLKRPPSRLKQEHPNILQNQEHANQRTLTNQPNQEHYLNRPPSRLQQEHQNILQNQEHANQRTLNQYQLQQEHINFPQNQIQYQLKQEHNSNFPQNQHQPEQKCLNQVPQQDHVLRLLNQIQQQQQQQHQQNQMQDNRSNFKKNPKNHPLVPGLRADKALIDHQHYTQFCRSTQPNKSYTTGNQQNYTNQQQQPSTSSYVSPQKIIPQPSTSKSTATSTSNKIEKLVVDDFDHFLNYSTENLDLLANTATAQNIIEKTKSPPCNPLKKITPNYLSADQIQSPVRVERQPYDDQSYAALAKSPGTHLAATMFNFSEIKQLVAEENFCAIMPLIEKHKEGNTTDAFLNQLINALISTPHNYPTFFNNLSDMTAFTKDLRLNYMLKTIGVNLVLYLCENNQYDPAFRINNVLTAKYKKNDLYDVYNCKIYLKFKYSYFRRILIIAEMHIIKNDIPLAWTMLRDNALSCGTYWQNNHNEGDLKYRDFVLGKLFEAFKKIKNAQIALDALLYLMNHKNTDINIREHANSILVNAINNKCNFDKIQEFMNSSPNWYEYLNKNTIRAILVSAWLEQKDCVSQLYEIALKLRICPQLMGNETLITIPGHYHYAELQLYLEKFFQSMVTYMPITEQIIIDFSLNEELSNDEIPLLVHQYNSSKTVLAKRVTNILENMMKPAIQVLHRNNCLYLEPENVNTHLLYRLQSSSL